MVYLLAMLAFVWCVGWAVCGRRNATQFLIDWSVSVGVPFILGGIVVLMARLL